jgi:hypothetical protein
VATVIERIEEKLNIPKQRIIEDGARQFLKMKLRDLSIDIFKICLRWKVKSFDELWDRIEKGEVPESVCFDDLTRLEYLEIQKEKVQGLLDDAS